MEEYKLTKGSSPRGERAYIDSSFHPRDSVSVWEEGKKSTLSIHIPF